MINFFKDIIEKIKIFFTKKEKKGRLFFGFLLLIITLIFLLIGSIKLTEYIFSNVASPQTFFLGNDVSFKTKDEIKKIVSAEQDLMLKTKVVFKIEDYQNNKILKEINLDKILEKNSEDKIVDKIFVDFNKTTKNVLVLFGDLFKKKYYNFYYSINLKELESIKNEIRNYEKNTVNASIVIDAENKKFISKKEEIGFNYDFSKMQNDISNYINSNNKQISKSIEIDINKNINNPIILEDKIQNTIVQANLLLNNSPISVYYNDKEYVIEITELLNFLNFEYSLDDSNQFTEASIKLKQDYINTFFDKIAIENDKKPDNGKIVVKDDKVSEFMPITKGTELDKVDSYNKLQDAILTSKNQVYLTVKESSPTELDSEVVKYGLLEKIAEGSSTFTGSSVSRVHNIKTGTGYVQGVLVKPGEEFSMIKTLKAVDASMGYVQELVIKGDRTTKEYGGGLCQVGTTMFRTALNGGFPILERQNHSYRVPYYEPAGTDATIYFPKPDFRFLNNTKKYILITTKLDEKNFKLVYDIWGTKDNRKIKIGDPIITNIVMAPGTKWIETLDLPVGKVKCSETSHNGADAQFSYDVEYEDGTKFNTVFKSHYRPWQAVCMKGVEKLTEPAVPVEVINSAPDQLSADIPADTTTDLINTKTP